MGNSNKKMLQNFRNFSIRLKLILIMSITAAIALLLAISAMYSLEHIGQRSNAVEDLASLAATSAWNSATALASKDRRAAKKILAALKNEPGIMRACLYDDQGRIFAEYFYNSHYDSTHDPDFINVLKRELQQGFDSDQRADADNRLWLRRLFDAFYVNNHRYLSSELNRQIYRFDRHGHLHIIQDLQRDGKSIGAVYIMDNMERFAKNQRTFLFITLSVLLISLIIVVLLSIGLQRLISVPIIQLMTAMKSVATEKNFSTRINTSSNDGFGNHLAEVFNVMLNEIEQRDLKLTGQRKILEQRVMARTFELSKKNEQLEHAMTEIIEAKKAVELANRAKSDFLAMISHEIRTPLNGVLGMAELLQGTTLDHQQNHFLTMIRRSGNILLHIINDIVSYPKIESDKLVFGERPFYLRELVEETLELLASCAHAKGLELISDFPDDLQLQLVGDENRLRQILMNLLSNAIKFTEHGEIVLKTVQQIADERAQLQFSVIDTDTGIPKTVFGAIFDSFVQVDGSITRKYQGTGLELSIAVYLIETMGGKLQVNSKPGKGSSFQFSINLPRIVTGQKSILKQTELNGTRLLIIGGNATNRALLCRQLSSWGVVHDCLDNCTKTMEFIRIKTANNIRHKVIVLNLAIQHETELKFLSESQSDPLLSAIPFVILCPTIFKQESAAYHNAGQHIFLTKPCRQVDLYGALKCALHLNNSGPIPAQPTPQLKVSKRLDAYVLLAEDNPINQEVTLRMLELIGCKVEVAANGFEAVNAVAKTRFDLILMDCHMPEMDGFQATVKIRKMEAERGLTEVPIIALTADVQQGIIQHCATTGMNGYLSKPFNVNQIRDLIFNQLAPKNSPMRSLEENQPGPAYERGKQQAILDQQALANIRSLQRPGKADIVTQVLTQYLQYSPNLVEAINKYHKGDPALLRDAAHSLKSSSANIGAMRLAECCRLLENQYTNGQPNEATELVAQMNLAYNSVIEEVKKEIDRLHQ